MWDLYQLDYGHMHAEQRWSALDSSGGKTERRRSAVNSQSSQAVPEFPSRSLYLQVTKETSQVEAPLLRVPVLVRTDILKASIGKYSIVIF